MLSEKSLCVFQVSGSPQLLSGPSRGATRRVLLSFQGEACVKMGATQAAEMTGSPGCWGRAACLLPEVLGAVGKGRHQEGCSRGYCSRKGCFITSVNGIENCRVL